MHEKTRVIPKRTEFYTKKRWKRKNLLQCTYMYTVYLSE